MVLGIKLGFSEPPLWSVFKEHIESQITIKAPASTGSAPKDYTPELPGPPERNFSAWDHGAREMEKESLDHTIHITL